MNIEVFQTQMRRLSSQWKNTYGEDRIKRLWDTWRSCDDTVFIEVVDRALDTMRAAPLAEDLARIEGEVKMRRSQERAYSGMGDPSIMGILNKSFKAADYKDPDVRERIQLRLKILHQYLDGKINKKQFDEGQTMVNKITPGLGCAE